MAIVHGAFPIRPIPAPGEDILGFFHRAVRRNHVRPLPFLQDLAVNAGKRNWLGNNIALSEGLLDCAHFPGGAAGLRSLCPTAEEPQALTFAPVAARFGIRPDDFARTHAGHGVIVRTRRLCLSCFATRPVTLLIWQVGEIQACPVHHERLLDACLQCGQPLALCPPRFSMTICRRCGHDHADDRGAPWTPTAEDDARWADWQTLLAPGEWPALAIPGLGPRRALATCLAWWRMGCPVTLPHPQPSDARLRYMLNVARGSRPEHLGIQVVLDTARASGVSVAALAGTVPPASFVESLGPRLGQVPADSLRCPAPWCPAPRSLRRLAVPGPAPQFVCAACGMRYALTEGGRLANRDGLLDVGWARVRPLLDQGLGLARIARETGAAPHLVRTWVEFLVENGLVSPETRSRWRPGVSRPGDPARLVEAMRAGGHRSIRTAGKALGWPYNRYRYAGQAMATRSFCVGPLTFRGGRSDRDGGRGVTARGGPGA